MSKRKQVLAIGRKVLGKGCDYSENNKLTRRIKYLQGNTDKVAELQTALNDAGLREATVHACEIEHGSRGWGGGVRIVIPISW